jgi:hypothetical protein
VEGLVKQGRLSEEVEDGDKEVQVISGKKLAEGKSVRRWQVLMLMVPGRAKGEGLAWLLDV